MIDLALLPDHLLAPLLDTAAAMVQAVAADAVPTAARSLVGFDHRGLARGPARRQLRRALTEDAAFREATFTAFGTLSETQAALGGWRPADALAIANAAAAAADDSLAWLASALVVGEPGGAELGLGVVVAVDAVARAERADATATRLAAVEEKNRRLVAERAALTRERSDLAEALREERRARRERTRAESVAADAEIARARVGELEAAVARATERAERAEAERARAVTRATRGDAERADAIAGRERAEAEHRAAVAARADGLTAELAAARRELATRPEPEPEPQLAAPRSERGGRGRARGRAYPNLPGGLVADTVGGTDAMLRGGPVVLVVDGYNVSKAAGAGGSLAVERDWLVQALRGLHLTSGVQVAVVFDGDGTPGLSKPKAAGVRVVFSPPGEEADSVVVEMVAATPKTMPVVVASSDRWVREHAETFGAVVVSAATLLGVLRKAP